MTNPNVSDREVTRVIRSWLQQDRHEDATRVLAAALDEVAATPRRRTTRWPAWRTLAMNNALKYGLAAAAAVVVVILGYQFLFGPDVGGPAPSPSIEPAPSAPASVEPSAPADGSLSVGSQYVLWDGSSDGAGYLGITISVTVPATGWFGHAEDGSILKNDTDGPPDGAGIIAFARTNDLLVGLGDLYIYGDPCHWQSTKPATPVTTVDEAVAALTAQAFRDTSAPTDVTYGGYSGKALDVHVPATVVFSDCDQGQFRTLLEGDEAALVARAPGQSDVITVLDVKGEVVIIDATYYDGGTYANILDEIGAIVESMTFVYDGP